MKKRTAAFMGLALTAVIGAALLNANTAQAQAGETAGTKAAPSVCGALHVEGTKLLDSQGKVVQLKGILRHVYKHLHQNLRI